MPSHYAGNHSVQTESGGEVVIVMPASDPADRTDSILLNRLAHDNAVCIDPDIDIMDPNSPRTITESSSNSFTTHIRSIYLKPNKGHHVAAYHAFMAQLFTHWTDTQHHSHHLLWSVCRCGTCEKASANRNNHCVLDNDEFMTIHFIVSNRCKLCTVL